MDGKDIHGRLFHVNYATEITRDFHSGGGGYSQNDGYRTGGGYRQNHGNVPMITRNIVSILTRGCVKSMTQHQIFYTS